MIRIKRTYEPVERGDGQRILVERLWPRGMKKEALGAYRWAKEVAPSTELRQWFAHRVERWEEFRRRYQEELKANRAAWEPILAASRRATVTLLYSAHDTDHNGAVVLRDFLARQPRTTGARAPSEARPRRARVAATRHREADRTPRPRAARARPARGA